MKWFKSKPTYTQEEIMQQQRIVAEAVKARNSLRDKEEHTRASTAVEVAQEILNFMLEEVESGNKK